MKLDAEKGERKCKEEREKLEHVIVDKKVQECISGEEREELYYVVVDRERGNDRSKARNKGTVRHQVVSTWTYRKWECGTVTMWRLYR